MRVSIDAEGIEAAFTGENECLEEILRSSILGITQEIIEDYTNKLLRNGSGLGKDWLEKRIFCNPDRMLIVDENNLKKYDLVSLEDLAHAYIGAAYHNGHRLIRDNAAELNLTQKKSKTYGLKLFDSDNFNIDYKTIPGNEIIFSLKLNSKTAFQPKSIEDFFCNEREIVVYDRYICERSIELLEQLLKKCHQNFSATIISEFETNRNSLFSADDTRRRLKKSFGHATISCYYPNFKELEDKHDRHIYLGQRIQLTFTSGLDCFGRSPEWKNSECDIYAHILDHASVIKEYPIKTTAAGSSRKKIKVTSKI